jgi:hypothetical protein
MSTDKATELTPKQCVGFLCSVIQGGEQFTEQCEDAKAALLKAVNSHDDLIQMAEAMADELENWTEWSDTADTFRDWQKKHEGE